MGSFSQEPPKEDLTVSEKFQLVLDVAQKAQVAPRCSLDVGTRMQVSSGFNCVCIQKLSFAEPVRQDGGCAGKDQEVCKTKTVINLSGKVDFSSLFVFSCLSLYHCLQPVHVGAAREHQEALHLPVGGVHQLLRPAVPTHGLYDW